jgi:sRNA-binding protein
VADIEKLELKEFEGVDISDVVSWYETRYGMHKATQAGAARIDLERNKVGVVTESEARIAVTEINRINGEKSQKNVPNPHDYDTSFPSKRESAFSNKIHKSQLSVVEAKNSVG